MEIAFPVAEASRPKPRTWQAATVRAPEEIELTAVPWREPAENEVRVRVTRCGVCASNIPPWEGRPWFQYPLEPGALGHEGIGLIDALGGSVEGWAVGDAVAFLGQQSYAEFDFVTPAALVRLPKNLANTAFPAEPLACAWNILQRARIAPGDKVAVIGIGFLGALILDLLRHREIPALAITRRPEGLNLARSLGAETASFSPYGQLVQHLPTAFRQGCEVVIEATGSQDALDLATELTGERGRLVIAGYHQDGRRTINLQMWNWRGIDVINAHERDPEVYLDAMRETIRLAAEGAIHPLRFITHHFPLEQLPEALTLARDRPAGFLKAVIDL